MTQEWRPLRWGVASLVEHPMRSSPSAPGTTRPSDTNDIWVPDERLLRNVYVSLATHRHGHPAGRARPAVTNP